MSIGQTEVGMPGDLKLEMTISSFVQKSVLRGSSQRQSTEYEGAGSEGKGLLTCFLLETNEFDAFDLAKFLFGDEEITIGLFESCTNMVETQR